MALQPDRRLGHHRAAAVAPRAAPGHRSAEAILIADLSGNTPYASRAAREILLWPAAPGSWSESRTQIAQRMKPLLRSSPSRSPTWPSAVAFTSGRRRYICRSSRLESLPGMEATWLLVLEREAGEPDPLAAATRRYGFTHREGEVVRFLAGGMVTKEIADHMGISVNTVKAFIRLVMCKMNVTTRSGIVGKALSAR